MSYDNLEAYLDQPETESEGNVVETTEDQPVAESENGEDKSSELALEQQIDKMEVKDTEKDGVDLLSIANSLGLIRNGLPIEFESEDQIKEAIQKGVDYTHKTQELGGQRKQWDEERQKAESEFSAKVEEFEKQKQGHEAQILENKVLFNILKGLEDDYPDVLEEIERRYDSQMQMYHQSLNNPAVTELKGQVDQLKSMLEGKNHEQIKEENSKIIKEWEDGLAETQKAYAAKMKTLGVKPNWEKVQQKWKTDESMSVKDALFAVHGEEMTKALESKQKLVQTKAKSQLRGNAAPAQKQTGETKQESYLEAAMRIANGLQ